MSWSDPDVLRKVEAESTVDPRDPVLLASLALLERMAASSDPSQVMQAKLMQACIPALNEWQELIKRRNIRDAAIGTIGIADAFANLFGNVLAAVPRSLRPRLKVRFDQSLASSLIKIEAHLEAVEKQRQGAA